MPKYDVKLRWVTTEVAHSTIEVEADSPEAAREAAIEMIDDEVCWGKPTILDGEHHVDGATEITQ